MGSHGVIKGQPFRGLAIVLVLLASSLGITTLDVAALPGDLNAPVHRNGDWWNYSVESGLTMPSRVGDYDIDFTDASGYLRYEVEGTESRLGEVAWKMAVTGNLVLTGEWTGEQDSGSTQFEAQVAGTEWRSTSDLAYLGSNLRYSGKVEISTMSGPVVFSILQWENRTLDSPLRLMLFPVPVAQFPTETRSVNITTHHASANISTTTHERWDYTSTYKGLADVQGRELAYVNMHRFEVRGNWTAESDKEPFTGSVYYDSQSRHAVVIDELSNTEVSDFYVTPSQGNPDLVVVDEGFWASDTSPAEGKDVVISAEVHNLGVRDLLLVAVELWASKEDDIPIIVNETSVDLLTAGSKVHLEFNWTATDIGDWTFTVVIDPRQQINEEREDNNEASLHLTVKPFAERPNLSVGQGDLQLDPPELPLQNRTAVHVTLMVLNEGPGAATQVTVDWFLNRPEFGGTPIGWQVIIDHIPAGQSWEAWINWVADIPGEHEIWAYVDFNNTVNETDESDNYVHTPVIVVASPTGSVDLGIVRVRLFDSWGEEATSVPGGQQTTIQVLVYNVGPKNATNVHMTAFLDEETPAGQLGSIDVSIGASKPFTWNLPWLVDVADGEYEIIASAIALGQVEATFTDNTMVHGFEVGPREEPPPDVLVITIFADATVLKPVQVVGVSGKVTRQSSGLPVDGAEVTLSFKDQGNPVTVVTNERGRYLAQIVTPVEPGNYRLEISAIKGLSVGSDHTNVKIEKDPSVVGDGDDGEASTLRIYWILATVLVLSVGIPFTYHFLLSKAARERRIRRVHEEVVEIVEKEEETGE